MSKHPHHHAYVRDVESIGLQLSVGCRNRSPKLVVRIHLQFPIVGDDDVEVVRAASLQKRRELAVEKQRAGAENHDFGRGGEVTVDRFGDAQRVVHRE
jgi:hypothetical protein